MDCTQGVSAIVSQCLRSCHRTEWLPLRPAHPCPSELNCTSVPKTGAPHEQRHTCRGQPQCTNVSACYHAEAAALAQSSGSASAFAAAAASNPTVQSCLGSSSSATAKALATSTGGNANAVAGVSPEAHGRTLSNRALNLCGPFIAVVNLAALNAGEFNAAFMCIRSAIHTIGLIYGG